MDAVASFGILFTLLMIGLGIALAIAWIILPFAVFGLKKRLEIVESRLNTIITLLAVQNGLIEFSERQKEEFSKQWGLRMPRICRR